MYVVKGRDEKRKEKPMDDMTSQQGTETVPQEAVREEAPVVAPRMIGTKFCSTCGSAVFAEAEICVKCGVRLAKPKESVMTDKSRVGFALLFLFLGPLGIHDFYIGRTGMGIFWLLSTVLTLGFGAFITVPLSFIMGIVWLLKSDEEFANLVEFTTHVRRK